MTSVVRRLLPVPLAVVVLAGCGGAEPASTGSAVLPAEQVFAEAPVVVPDPSGTSATLQVTTEVDMACAVVFGREESLGDGIATDADMGGGAHAEHQAVMRGLEPGTEYFYRVQGSGADGRLYRSELMTFRTPDAEVAEVPGENAALGAEVVDVSSEFSDAFAAGNAVDGDLGTEWSSDGDGDDASITLDLGRAVDVVGLTLRSRSMSDGTSVVETFTVTVDDGQTYGPFEAGAAVVVNEADFTGRVLRFDAETTTGGNTGAAEIEVYEAS
ncbi:discoidin domain-containing protein [Blastococcus sp. BMG 814]|uniref:Discoidin domain-containing protein n=1 Tax=Blastococcus carthaginiensis TaxID=3050034 RepID=A0ABT9IFJ5_9ACTN|nr:discoidin domain-containing protein [Blastococcus carthaginiensis]MDP5184350.1 discoidin domain-containing protein [Blastococcus carthaginiensis]